MCVLELVEISWKTDFFIFFLCTEHRTFWLLIWIPQLTQGKIKLVMIRFNLSQVEEFKYLGVLFTSEGRMEREIDGRIGAASAVLWALHRPVVVKKELS